MDAYAKAQGFSGGSSSEYDMQVMILLMIVKDLYLFHTEEDVAYADIVIAEHRETHAILGKGFKRYLRTSLLSSGRGVRRRGSVEHRCWYSRSACGLRGSGT